MSSIRILSVGKTKEIWLDDAIEEYLKRLKSKVSIEFIYPKDDAKLLQLVEKEIDPILLDPSGSLMTSEQFSSYVFQKFEKGGAHITFVIGGPEGLPSSLKNQKNLLSLSPMTFTHQITRLILVEQIYRAFAIASRSPYHK